MYVLFLNVKNRRGTPWSTMDCTDCSVASRVVVMVQRLAHLTCNPGDVGSIPTHGIKCFFIRKGSVNSSLSLSVHFSLNTSITKRRVSFGSYLRVTTSLDIQPCLFRNIYIYIYIYCQILQIYVKYYKYYSANTQYIFLFIQKYIYIYIYIYSSYR